MKHALCPHCGYDLQLDTPILIDDFSMMNSMSHLWWRDQVIALTSSERIVCYTLMKAYPGPVRTSVLLERLDSDAEHNNIINVYISRIRRKIRDVGAPNPIVTQGRDGVYSWATGGYPHVGDVRAPRSQVEGATSVLQMQRGVPDRDWLGR